MQEEVSPHSPEERERNPQEHVDDHPGGWRELIAGPLVVVKRIVIGVFTDGFIHAGNLAYLTLLTLAPFFIMMAALASLFGRDADTLQALNSFLITLPLSVRELLRGPIESVLTARTGPLLWLGGAVGLWTVGSFIETIRDILRRAYGVKGSAPFWHYRLSSMAIIIGAVVLMMVAFTAQVLLTAVEQVVFNVFPFASHVIGWIQIGRLLPLVIAWGAIYLLMWSLTPSKYRFSKCPKWPGALFVAMWWFGALSLLPVIIASFSNYDLTYGSLAGVVIALIFFWFIGLGFVIGAHLNAALAESPVPALGEPQQA